MSYMEENLERLSVKPTRKPWGNDEDAVGESRDIGTRGAAADCYFVDPAATQMDEIPKGLEAVFVFYGQVPKRSAL